MMKRLDRTSGHYWNDLLWGNILGVINSDGVVDSRYGGHIADGGIDKTHECFWRGSSHLVRWRWSFDDGIHSYRLGEFPNSEEADSIRTYLTSKYGIPFYENGFHDMDFLNERIEEETRLNPDLVT